MLPVTEDKGNIKLELHKFTKVFEPQCSQRDFFQRLKLRETIKEKIIEKQESFAIFVTGFPKSGKTHSLVGPKYSQLENKYRRGVFQGLSFTRLGRVLNEESGILRHFLKELDSQVGVLLRTHEPLKKR